jgi:hypothetical protein
MPNSAPMNSAHTTERCATPSADQRKDLNAYSEGEVRMPTSTSCGIGAEQWSTECRVSAITQTSVAAGN